MQEYVIPVPANRFEYDAGMMEQWLVQHGIAVEYVSGRMDENGNPYYAIMADSDPTRYVRTYVRPRTRDVNAINDLQRLSSVFANGDLVSDDDIRDAIAALIVLALEGRV